MSGPEVTLALCRLLHDTALMLLWGTFGFLTVLMPDKLAGEIASRLAGFGRGAVGLAVVTTIATLPLEAAAIGDGWTDAVDPATLRAVLFETGVGHVWQARAGAALLLAAGLLVPRRLRAGAMAAGSGLLLAMLALTGHAAMHEGWLGLGHRANDALHVLAGGAWFGALVPVLLVLRRLEDPGRVRDAGAALRRFSSAGHAAVGLVVASGAVNTMLVLGRLPVDRGSPYQLLLAIKIALVLTMTTLALINRYGLVPRLSAAPGPTIAALRRATLAEIGLGMMAIGCVAVFGLLEPD